MDFSRTYFVSKLKDKRVFWSGGRLQLTGRRSSSPADSSASLLNHPGAQAEAESSLRFGRRDLMKDRSGLCVHGRGDEMSSVRWCRSSFLTGDQERYGCGLLCFQMDVFNHPSWFSGGTLLRVLDKCSWVDRWCTWPGGMAGDLVKCVLQHSHKIKGPFRVVVALLFSGQNQSHGTRWACSGEKWFLMWI